MPIQRFPTKMNRRLREQAVAVVGPVHRGVWWQRPSRVRHVSYRYYSCSLVKPLDRPNDGITVNNYPLLPQDASPSPSDMPSLLTWGTLLATPRALDGGDDPLDGPSFRMPASNRRDEIGRKLGDKASRSMNERAKGFTPRPNSALRALAGKTVQRGGRGDATPGSMAPPSATPQRRENLTPAGKRLLERSLGVSGRIRGAAQERNSGWGKSSTSSSLGWTPSPGRRK